MTLSGKVVKIGDSVTVSDKLSKRELWLEVPDGKYPQTLCIEFLNDKESELNKVSIGVDAVVSINLRGRIYKEKCYNSIQGWKIEAAAQSTSIGTAKRPFENLETKGINEENSDLPF